MDLQRTDGVFHVMKILPSIRLGSILGFLNWGSKAREELLINRQHKVSHQYFTFHECIYANFSYINIIIYVLNKRIFLLKQRPFQKFSIFFILLLFYEKYNTYLFIVFILFLFAEYPITLRHNAFESQISVNVPVSDGFCCYCVILDAMW